VAGGDLSVSVSALQVVDKEPPVPSCPTVPPATTAVDESSVIFTNVAATAVDNADVSPAILYSFDVRSPFPIGNTSVVVTAKGKCGDVPPGVLARFHASLPRMVTRRCVWQRGHV
jgi:hypothetical protein